MNTVESHINLFKEKLLTVYTEVDACQYLEQLTGLLSTDRQKNKVQQFMLHVALNFDISVERLCNSKSPREKNIRKACYYVLDNQLCMPYRSIANYFNKNKTDFVQLYIDEAKSLLDVREYEFALVYARVCTEFTNHMSQ